MIITSTKNARWQPGEQSAKQGIELTFGEEKQVVRGFGCCFSELGAKALNELSESDKKAVLDELFLPGNGNFNYCRTPIGASDFALEWYSYNETDGDYEMKNFSVSRDEKLLIPLIESALSRQDEMQMFASPWCPPLWMKTKRSYSAGVFNMTPQNLRAYALYFLKYVEAYRSRGIPLIQVAPQNEPCSNQIFPSCKWTGKQLTEFIGGYLGPALEGSGVDIIFGTINGPETDDRFLVTRYADYLGCAMMDEKAAKYIKGVGYQWAGKYALLQTADDYPGLEIIQTEVECGDGSNEWDYTMYLFENTRRFFRMGATANVYWNIALGKDNSSTWGWKQNSLVRVLDGKAEFTNDYYMMKHFSHFIKRGARYVGLTGRLASCCAAFVNPDGSKVIVASNPYQKELTVSFVEKSYILPPRSISTIVM